ncbi:MAG TPA: hypothetical protein VJ904_06090, partial [Tichowtungia sp.]|nr:hypothetical protein [Tichowtungia sp.]
PVDLSGDGVFVRWEAYANAGDTNAAIYKVGTVVDASAGRASVSLTPAEAGLPAGEYYSFVRAFEDVDGVSRYIGTLAYNRLVVEWSPNPANYGYTTPVIPDAVYTQTVALAASAVQPEDFLEAVGLAVETFIDARREVIARTVGGSVYIAEAPPASSPTNAVWICSRQTDDGTVETFEVLDGYFAPGAGGVLMPGLFGDL